MSANWELRFKACSAVAAVCSALSILVGGVVALHTYRQDARTSEMLKRKELRQHEYNQKREIYYELVDAAAGASATLDKADAAKNAARYWRLYYGKAHIAVIDDSVHTAKVQFARELNQAMKRGIFPTEDLEGPALALSRACRTVLLSQNLFSLPAEPTAEPQATVTTKPTS